MSKQAKALKKWRRKMREIICKSLGDKCHICNNKYDYPVYDVHHINETLKNETLSRMLSNPNSALSISQELQNCTLLCANCHRLYHHTDIDIVLTPTFNNALWQEFMLYYRKQD